MADSLALSMWQRLTAYPMGKWLFAQAFCWKAPYFGSIRPRFVELRPGFCEVTMRKRRGVLNHLGTVHAIAMCNLAEAGAGTVTDATVPATHRWIPKGMTVEYLRKAVTDLRGVARINPIPAFGDAAEIPVHVEVSDTSGETVFRAVIMMYVSPKRN